MNAKTSIPRRASRPSAYVFAALVVGLALSCSGRAVAVANGPNALSTTYNLAAGATSIFITPTSNLPHQVTGVCTTLGEQGVGQVVMLHASQLVWEGINSPGVATASSTITHGISGVPGVDIVLIDRSGNVVVEVQNEAGFRVDNRSVGTRTGSVTMIW